MTDTWTAAVKAAVDDAPPLDRSQRDLLTRVLKPHDVADRVAETHPLPTAESRRAA